MKRYTFGIQLLLSLFGLCYCLSLQAGSLAIQIVDDKHEPLADAVVYLTSEQPHALAVNESFEIEQKNKTFHPFVTIMPTGATASFPNRDGIGHHVYSFSPAKNFQLPLSEHESTEKLTFNKPGVVTVGCNIHDWMVAYIYVVDTDYYAKTGADGHAAIDNLPAGEYTIYIAHPGMKSVQPLTQSINVAVDGENRLEFSLQIKPRYFWQPAPRMHEEVY